jgi:hypothetical protein
VLKAYQKHLHVVCVLAIMLWINSSKIRDQFIQTVRRIDTSYRATILHQDIDAENHSNIKLLVALGDGKFDKINAYDTLSEL